MGLATKYQAQYWANDLALFTRGCAVAPLNAMARLNLAAELIRRGHFEEALGNAQIVIRHDPALGESYSLAGKSAFYLKEYPEAETYLVPAVHTMRAEPEDVFYLAMSQIYMGKAEEGLEALRNGLLLWPNIPQFHYASGIAFASMGKWLEAREQYQEELALHPGNANALSGLIEANAHLQLTGSAQAESPVVPGEQR
jgi:tetratricopeptide (TPR) repeat protein